MVSSNGFTTLPWPRCFVADLWQEVYPVVASHEAPISWASKPSKSTINHLLKLLTSISGCYLEYPNQFWCHFRQSTQGLREHRAAGSPPRLAATEPSETVLTGAESETPQKLRFFEKKKEGETRHGFLEELGGWSSEKLRKGDWESPTCAGRSVIPTCQPCPIVAGGLCTSCYIPFQDANYVTNICIYVLFIYLFIHLFIYLLTYLLTYLCVSLFFYFLIYLSICTYTHIHASIYIHICMCIYRHRSKTIYSYTRNISSYIYDYTYNYIYIYHLICIVCI